jgi:hypothetical protein
VLKSRRNGHAIDEKLERGRCSYGCTFRLAVRELEDEDERHALLILVGWPDGPFGWLSLFFLFPFFSSFFFIFRIFIPKLNQIKLRKNIN